MLIFEVSGEVNGGREERALLAKFAGHRLSAFCSDAEDYGRGLPHPAAYGAFARILGDFVRRDGLLPIEEAVRKMTSYPARLFGLADRGAIRPGGFADLVLFDRARIRDRATYFFPRREATGIDTVVINGRVAFAQGAVQASECGVAIR